MVRYHTAAIDGHQLFYREAGDSKHPTLLLLHGFPTSSHMFRNLIPRLEDRFHVVAPMVFPMPRTARAVRVARSDNLAKVIECFTDTIGLQRYAIYVFDCGAPVGFRLAVARPERVTAIISQNGNAYEEGLSTGWLPIQKYWQEPNAANRKAVRALLTHETTKWQYVHGVSDEANVARSPIALTLRCCKGPVCMRSRAPISSSITRAMSHSIPSFTNTLRRSGRLLAVWGKNDPFFLPQGAEAFRRHNANAEVHLYDTGHFALETHVDEIASAMRSFLEKAVSTQTAIRRAALQPQAPSTFWRKLRAN